MSTEASAHRLTRLMTCRPVALALPLVADPPPPLAPDWASPERAAAIPQLKMFAARFSAMLMGLWLSPATCTAADERMSTVFWTCAPVACALPLAAAVDVVDDEPAAPPAAVVSPEVAEAAPQFRI